MAENSQNRADLSRMELKDTLLAKASDSSLSPRVKASVYRQLASLTSGVDSEKWLQKVDTIVDNFDSKSGGLNNYAELSLALASKYKDLRKGWKCELDFDDDFVKEASKSKDNDKEKCLDFLRSLGNKKKTYKAPKNATEQTKDTQMASFELDFDENFHEQAPSQAPPVAKLPRVDPSNVSRPFHPLRLQNCPPTTFGVTQRQPAPASCLPRPSFADSTDRLDRQGGQPVQRSNSRDLDEDVRPAKKGPQSSSWWLPSVHRTNSGGEQENKDDAQPKAFRTARDQLVIDSQNRKGQISSASYGATRKFLGGNNRGGGGVSSLFKPPVIRTDDDPIQKSQEDRLVDERLKNIDPKMIELIENEIMERGSLVQWSDIAGLDFVKKTVKEIVVFPMLRPDIFTGLRAPPKGLLLFGPPGTGKTLIGKCIAAQSKSTFFSISSSSLTSKWIGEGEKMVRAMFAVARVHQPSVVFIDEIDSLLTARSDTEHESSRRLKTEFLVQLDGATTVGEERILVVGATNRPQDLDEAARRRLVKRLYVPLPEEGARKKIIENLMANQPNILTPSDINEICRQTDGYSGADMTNLCKEAAMGPIRSLNFSQIEVMTSEQVRPIGIEDFKDALRQVKASVSDKDLDSYQEWNRLYGAGK